MRRFLRMGAAVATLCWGGGALADDPVGPTPIDPATWITHEDYPVAALQQGLEGIVEIVIGIDAAGKVTGCTGTGAGTLLNEATCRILLPRVRFDPARDASGKAIPATYRHQIRWLLPREAVEPFATVTRVTVAPGGAIVKCEIWQSRDAAVPQPCAATDAEAMARDMRGDTTPGVITYSTRQEIKGGVRAATLPGSDVPPYWTQDEHLTIEADGTVSACRIIRSNDANIACTSGERFAAAPGRPPVAMIRTTAIAFQPAK